MKHIIDQIEQLARQRLLTRLKHLRGQHDQRDHAWNRGMGVGGGAVELGPNQMGPLPTMQMYRQQKLALMDQYRRGDITRQEMRQQTAQLRGLTNAEPLNNVVLANQNKRSLVLSLNELTRMDDKFLAQIAKREVAKFNTDPELLTPYQWRQVFIKIKKSIPRGAINDFGKKTLSHYEKLALGTTNEDETTTPVNDEKPENVQTTERKIQLDSLYTKQRELSKEIEAIEQKQIDIAKDIYNKERQMEDDAHENARLKMAQIMLPMLIDEYTKAYYETFNLELAVEGKDPFDDNQKAEEYIKENPNDSIVQYLMKRQGISQFIQLKKIFEEDQDSGDLTNKNTYSLIRANIELVDYAIRGSNFQSYQPSGLFYLSYLLWRPSDYLNSRIFEDAINFFNSNANNETDVAQIDNLKRIRLQMYSDLNDIQTMKKEKEDEIDKLARSVADIRRKNNTIADDIRDIKTKMIDNGESLVTKLYSDEESKKYFDPSLTPDDTKPFLDTHVELGELISQNQDFIDVMKNSFGLDADNPEHVQIIGDILGVFSDSSSYMSAYANGTNWNDRLTTEFRYDNDSNGKGFLVKRNVIRLPDKIVVDNDLFKQTKMQGMGRAALIRQIPAAIKLSRIAGVPVRIEANAYSRGSEMIGYHVWPKMSFNFAMHDTVGNILRELGFADDDLIDTATFMQSTAKAQDPDPYGLYAGMYFDYMKKLVGKNARQVWADVVELAILNDGVVNANGSATIDASDPNGPVQIFDLLLEEYNKELRLRQNKSTKSVRDNIKYKKYLDLIGFSMEDMDAFDAAWETVSKKKK